MNFFERITLKYLSRLLRRNVSLTNYSQLKKMFEEWISGNTSSSSNTGYISAAVDVWGLSFAKVRFRLYDRDEDNAEVTDHPVVDLFRKPNWFQTFWEIKYRIAQDFAFYGNSYLLKLRDPLGVPRAIVQLHPDRVNTYPYNIERIDYYEYETGSRIYKLEPGEIIHFRYPDPDNYIKGLPVISKILDLREIEKLQIAYRKQFYKKGGFLGAVFTTDQKMTDASFRRSKQELQENYSGSTGNAFQIALFEQGLKPIPTAYSLKDMQMTEDRNLNRDEILSAFKVNKLLLGQSELIQRGNADTVYYVFASNVVDPIMDYIDEALTLQLAIPDFATDVYSPFYIKHDRSADRDNEAALRYYESGLKYGWLSPDEVREEEGYEPFGGEYAKPTLNAIQNITTTQ